ncbi:hypothetical protein IMZ48_46570 [Candidatus Bathyarchaeota archaeon]|nr:hypothetical protein [Candidatus Bathyarchaeota archaeon]
MAKAHLAGPRGVGGVVAGRVEVRVSSVVERIQEAPDIIDGVKGGNGVLGTVADLLSHVSSNLCRVWKDTYRVSTEDDLDR